MLSQQMVFFWRQLVALAIILMASFVRTLDVSFIPADENNPPLPLSTNYRNSLRKLCELMKSDAKLPAEVEQKRKVLQKMCVKLAKDDQNIAGSISNHPMDTKKWLVTILSLGAGFILWNQREWLFLSFRQLVKRNKPNVHILGRSDNNNPYPSQPSSAPTSLGISVIRATDADNPITTTMNDDSKPDALTVADGEILNANMIKQHNVDMNRILEAREARLKRFAEMNRFNDAQKTENVQKLDSN